MGSNTRLQVSITHEKQHFTSFLLPYLYRPSTDRNIYHLSFFWHTALGGVICTGVALLVSLVFGWQDVSQMDPALITPCMRRFLPKRNYEAVDLEELFKRKAETEAKTSIKITK